MAVIDLLNLLSEAQPGQPMDWLNFQEDIHSEFKVATTVGDRESLLALHKLMNDNIEQHFIETNDPGLETIRQLHRKDHHLFILSECVVGERISHELAREETEREVKAGRMSPDDEFYKLEQASVILNLPSHAEVVAEEAKLHTKALASYPPPRLMDKLISLFKGQVK